MPGPSITDQQSPTRFDVDNEPPRA